MSDVKAILKEKKVDLDNNWFLILQGEVLQISLMKPLDLLYCIEDVVDTIHFNKPLDKLDMEIT